MEYHAGERVWALSKEVYYKAQVVDIATVQGGRKYKVKYQGFSARYNEFLPGQSLMKINKSNNDIARESVRIAKEKAGKFTAKSVGSSGKAKKSIQGGYGEDDDDGNDRNRKKNNEESESEESSSDESISDTSEEESETVDQLKEKEMDVDGVQLSRLKDNRNGKKKDKKKQRKSGEEGDNDDDYSGEDTQDSDILESANETFNILFPNRMKKQAIEDYTSVSKGRKLIPLPRIPSVTKILQSYVLYKTNDKKKVTSLNQKVVSDIELQTGNSSSSAVQPLVDGIREYFNTLLGPLLLCTSERQQYFCATRTLQVKAAEREIKKEEEKKKKKYDNSVAGVVNQLQMPFSSTSSSLIGLINGNEGRERDGRIIKQMDDEDDENQISLEAFRQLASPIPIPDSTTQISDIYGGEHLLRLILRLPDILADSPQIQANAGYRHALQSRIADIVKFMDQFRKYIFNSALSNIDLLSPLYDDYIRRTEGVLLKYTSKDQQKAKERVMNINTSSSSSSFISQSQIDNKNNRISISGLQNKEKEDDEDGDEEQGRRMIKDIDLQHSSSLQPSSGDGIHGSGDDGS